MALLDDELAPDLPPLPDGFRLVEPAKGSAAPARAKPSLPPLPEGFRLVDPAAKAVAPVVAEEGGFLDSAANIAKGAGERVMDLAGGALRTGGAAIETIRQAGLAGAEMGARHAGTYGADDIAKIKEEAAIPSLGKTLADKKAAEFEATKFGYQPGTTWEDVKASPLKNFASYALETGLVSAPDMAAAMAALPAYLAARAGEMGQERAVNNNTENATAGDILAVMPSAALSALLDRLGGRAIFGLGDVAVQSLKQLPKEIGKAALKEGATEAAQEGIERTGTDLGTEKGLDVGALPEEMLAAGVAGAGFGAGVRTGSGLVERVRTPRETAAETSARPPLPEGFKPVENAVERAEGSGRAPAGPATDDRVSPPFAPSPAAVAPEQREMLRQMGWTDDAIDAMSAEEIESEAGQYRAVTPSAVMPSAPEPARSPDNVGIAPTPAQGGKEILSELPIAPPLSTRRGLASDASRSRPAEIEKAPDLDIAGQRVNTEPTDAQKEAGNYKKAHVRVAGLDVTIENPKGSIRRGRDPDGQDWESPVSGHYGYVKRTIGADGDHIDIIIGDNPQSKKLYIIDQKANSPRGRFDEHKLVGGVNSLSEARDIYVRMFSDGSGNQRLGAITAVTPKALRDFLASPQSARSAYRMGKERLTEAGFPATTDGKTKRPPSLTEFLAAAGGIRDHGGELAAMDAGKIFLPGTGKLVRQNGRTLDQARALAVENGYLQDAAADQQSTSTLNDLLVALRDDIGSYRHFSTYDDDWAGAWADEQASVEGARREGDARGRAETELGEIGLSREADPEFYDRALEMVMGGMDAADALERAAVQLDAAAGVVADDTPATPYFFDEEPTDAVQRGATPESSPVPGDQGAEGDRPEEAGGAAAIGEAPQDRGEGGAAEPDYDGALDAALDSEFPPLPEGFRLVEPGAEGKPQAVIPGAERISTREEAQRAADKPLRAKAAQKDVGGLFGDEKDQTDLLDLPGAKQEAAKPKPAKEGEFQPGPVLQKLLDAKLLPFRVVDGVARGEGAVLQDPAPRIESRLFQFPIVYDGEKLRIMDNRLAREPFAQKVKKVAGVGFEPATKEQRERYEWFHAVDLAEDDKFEQLIETAEFTKPGLIASAAAFGFEHKQLSAENAALLMKEAGIARPDNAELDRILRNDVRQTSTQQGMAIHRPKEVDHDIWTWLLIRAAENKWLRVKGDFYMLSPAGIDTIGKGGDGPPPTPSKPSVKSAAKSAAMGIEEVTKGLSTLFGGGKVSSGLTFDDETYRKALPFFRAGVAHFADAGRDVAEMAKRLVRHLAQNGMDRDAIERMRPYLVRFMKDWRAGVEPKAEAAAPATEKKPAEHPGLVIKSLETGKETTIQPPGTVKPAASNPAEKINTVAPEEGPEPSGRKTPHKAWILNAVRDRLIGGEAFATINQARKFLADSGWKAKDEAIANKEAEELIEHAVVLAARDIVKAGKQRGPGVVFDRLVGLYERQPRLATRTSQSMAEQAYSTPAPLAYVASRLAGIDSQTSVLEPSAGNGMLLIEASQSKAHVNEIADIRAANLEAQGYRVHRKDASEPGLRHEGYPVDVVIANPPFGAVRKGGESTVFDIAGHRTTAIDQAIALNALQHMKDDGRAVLIVGSVKGGSDAERSDQYNTSQKRKFYKRLYDNYNVVQHFTVDGKLYQKQGAAWPVDVIVIEGKGKSAYPYPAARVPGVVGSWAELKGYVDGSSNRAESADGRAERVPVESGSEVSRPAPAIGRPDAGDSGRSGAADGGRPSVQPSRPERQPETGSVPDDRGQREPDGNLDGDPRPEPLAGGGDAGRAHQRVAPRERPSRLADDSGKGQVPYRPYSHEGTKLNTLVPRALGDAMDASLAKVEAQHGDIDSFVAQSLGYELSELKDVFSAEQIDAVALAIDNVAKGDAFIIGDQTGIGKGRVVAAAIRFAHRRGMVPIFVTEKPDLYGDMYRDLADIRWAKSLGRDPNIYMTNANTTVPLDDEAVEWVIERDEARADGRKLPPRRGQFTKAQAPADAEKRMREILAGTFKPDVVFTTYDQMNTVKGEETARRRFMDQVSPRAFLIMDESHNAGGQGAKGNERAKKGAPMPRSKKFREWLGKAKAAMYSSATYAKNPTVMDLYSRTDMAKAVDDIEELPDLITKGRVPLQQVVASMLANAGQYARRERSFEGVEYALDVAEVDKDNYAAFAGAIRSIFKFDRAVSDFRKEWIDTWLKENAAKMEMDGGVGDIAANSTEFSSIMHNLVNQMLLAIKAEAAAQRALKSLEDGEKPVVALSFTNESFLSDYAADHGTEIGDDLGLTFRDMLQRYLDRALRITLKTDDDEKMHVFIPVEDLPGHERMLFDAAQEMVSTADVGGLPISPIDHIRHRLKDAGYRVAEITGRGTMIDYGHETPRYAERPRSEQGATGKRATIKKYNDGQLDAVILNRSGSTGVSMHSSSKYKDQRRRRMILAQAEGNIDTHMQMLGRVHRTGQVIPPAYTQLAADIPAEARPTAVLMKKMASLSANTTASRKSNFSADAVDFMNEYGDLAAVQWAKDNSELAYEMGEPIRFDDKGKLQTENPMQRLTGRIMLLDPDQQQDMLEALTQTYTMILAQKEALGENVLEATALDLEAEKIGSTVMKPALGPSPFQASADLDTYRVKAPGRAMKPRDVVDAVVDGVGAERPTSWEFARALPALQRRGQTKAEDMVRRTSDEFQSYRKWVVDGVKDAEKKQKASQDAQAMWDHWSGVVRRAPVGAHVILTTGENETPAIVTGIVKSKRKANSPVQLSTWSVRLAIPDDSRELSLPFTQILLSPDKEADGIEIRQAGWQDKLDNLEQQFVKASTVGHEERVIATGNILAAFDQLQGKGRIIQFTDKDGATKPGILMPRGYSAEVYAKERQVRFQNASQAMRFLKESDGKQLTDDRENIDIRNTYEGYAFEINASRLKGGRYFTDDTVRKVYDKWTKYGNQMQATVDEATAKRLIEAMQSLGAKFVASSEQEFAQKIVYPDAGKNVQAQIMAQPAEVPADVAQQPANLTHIQMLEVAEIVARVSGLPETSFLPRMEASAADAGIAQWGIGGDGRVELAGTYSPIADVITISMRTGALARQTAFHEAFHRVQGKFLNVQERALLARERPTLEALVAMKRGNPSIMSQKEIEAEAFAIWSEIMETDGAAFGVRLHIGLRRAWARLQQMFERVRNYLRGEGFQTWEDVFETARAGKMKDRPAGSAAPDGNSYYQPAWHGTPHRFDKFSTEKIGTGEGAQAYGWGLYFAGRRGVAEHYRNALSKRAGHAVKVTWNGETFDDINARLGAMHESGTQAEQDALWDALQAISSIMDARGDVDLVIETMTKNRKSPRPSPIASWIERHRSELQIEKAGALYKVEVPNDDELMLWDAPLSEQPQGVREKLHKAEIAHRDAHSRQTGEQVYRIASRDLGGDRAASEALRAAGIPGHKYADGQSRVQGLRILSPKDSVSGKWVVGQAPNGPNQYFATEAEARAAYQKIRDEQTYNYVIYDDSRVEVVEQYQIMPTAEELARVPVSVPPRAVPGALVSQRINRVLRSGTTLAKKTFKDDRRTVGDDEGSGDYVTRKMVDYLLPVLRMQQKVGTKLSELNDAYLNARVAEDAALAQVQTMHDTYVKPMVEALASAGVGLEDFHKYLYALHVEERNEVVGLRHKPDTELFKAIDNHDLKGASGWSTNEAKGVLAELRGDPARWRALRQAGAYTRAMIDVELRNAKRTGLISEETYDILTTQWKNYVPMKGQDGMDDEGFWRPGAGGFDVRGQEHKTAMGRFSEAENVIAHAITQNETSILRQHKNTVGKAMLRFVNQFDPSGDDIAEVYWAGKDGFGDIEKADDIWKRRIGRDGKVEWYRVPNPFASRDDVLATKVGGKTYWIKFHDPKVGLALRKLSKTEISGISKIMRPITVWQSVVNTRANPAFTPVNIIRDVLTGSVHLLDENFNARQVAGIVRNIPKAWGGLWRQIGGTEGDTEWDKLAREYMAAGGRITFHGYADLEKTLKNLQREVTQAIEGKSPMRKAWDAVTGFVAKFNDVGENGIRLAAYAAARKQGRTAKESAFMARDLTVDFKKHGDWGQEFNSWFVFFNAALQGNVNIITRMTRSKYVRRAVAGFAFVGLMQHFWNAMMAGEDDDGESYYRKMLINEPWKLERQFVFFIPGSGGKYVSFPMPYGYNAFHHMGVQAGAVMSGDKGALPATLDVLRVYFDAFNPIGSGSIVSMISPTVADPVIDILANENFAGNPIYPSENVFDKSPDPQSYRSFSTTHPAFKTTAEWLNWLSGGTEVEPGAADVHPDTLEHLWGWATGGLGRFLTDTTSVAGNALEGEFEPKSTPWVKSFYGEIDGDSQRTEYFRERERVLAVEGYLKAYGERGDSAAVQRYQERNKVELEALGAFKAAEKQRREINKERRRIEGAQMPEAQRAKAIEALDKREAEAMRMARTAFSRAEDQ